MATEPLKTSVETDGSFTSLPDYFYSAASIIESGRHRWFMEDLDRIEAELHNKIAAQRLNYAIKRAIDIIGSFILIVLLSPVFLITAVAVRLTSPGPVMYAHKRWAMGQKKFICLKFRSMRTDQDKVLDIAELQKMQQSGILLKLKKDPRLTPIGSFIRKTSIDELPQLFNVLKGDMSLVGPRPLVLHMMEPYPEIRRVRCMMRPGISGLWQIRDRENNISVLGMLPHDVDYLLNFTPWLDIKILLSTLPAVIWGTGAC